MDKRVRAVYKWMLSDKSFYDSNNPYRIDNAQEFIDDLVMQSDMESDAVKRMKRGVFRRVK